MFSFLKQKKNILAVVLTSSDEKRALRAYESIKNSPTNFSMDIEIIVNSLNKDYIKSIQQTFKNIKVKITETQSNGHSGFGKNTVFDYFRNHKNQYDYLFLIDGDDFLYPTAFKQFEQVLSMNPDIVGLQSSDTLITSLDYRAKDFIEETKNESEFLHLIEDPYYLHSWNDLQINMSKQFPKDIYSEIHKQYPPDRTLFLSHRILNNEKDLGFPKDMSVYDDYVFCFMLYQRAIKKEYSYAHFSSSYCYVYDRINDAAQTKKHEDGDLGRQWIDKKAKEYLLPLFQESDFPNFSIVPHVKLEKPENFNLEEKVNFIKNNLII